MTRAQKQWLPLAAAVAALSFTGSLRAQNLQIYDSTGNKPLESITINVPPGGTASDQTFVVKSTSGAEQPLFGAYLHLAELNNVWTASLPYDRMNTPTQVTIQQSFDAPNDNVTINGTLFIETKTAIYQVPVYIRIGSPAGEGEALTVDRRNLTFRVQPGGSSQATLSVLSSSGTATTFTASVTSPATAWLTVAPAATSISTGTSNLTVRVDSSDLAEGTYTGTITLTPAGDKKTTTMNVTLNVGGSGTGAGDLMFTPSSLLFTVPGTTTSDTIYVSSAESTDFSISTLTFPAGASWLAASVGNGDTSTTGSTPATISVVVNPFGLAPGTYTAQIVATTSGGHTQIVPVTLAIGRASDSISALPSSIGFLPRTTTEPVSQQVQIDTDPSGVFYTLSVTYKNGDGWLQVSDDALGGLTGTTPAKLNVTASVVGLPVGEYAAEVHVSFMGPVNATLTIPITLQVPGVTDLSLDSSALLFSGFVGSGENPPPQKVVVTTAGAGADFSTTANLTDCGGSTKWLTITPAAGTTRGSPARAAVTVAPDLRGITITRPNQICTGLVTFNVPGIQWRVLTVHLQLQPVPSPRISAVQNGASFVTGPIAAGEWIAIKGSNLGPAKGVSASPGEDASIPSTLGKTQVLLNGAAIPLTYVSANEIHAIVPYELASSVAASLQVKVPGAESQPTSVEVVPTSPGIFTLAGKSQVKMINENRSLNGSACTTPPCDTDAAPKGSVVEFYGTGEGILAPVPTTGSITPSKAPFAEVVNGPVTVKVGGVAITPDQVIYQGPAPGQIAGVLQVNFRVPDFVDTAAPVPLSIVVGGKESPPVIFIAKE